MIRALIISTGLLAAGELVCGVAEARPQSQEQAATEGGATAAKPKPKKVWTNDDMSQVTGTISVVGTPAPQRAGAAPGASPISSMRPGSPNPGQNKPASTRADATKNDGSVDPKMLAEMKQQLQKLHAGIDQLDKQIEQLKGASRGDSKNLGGLNADTWSYSTASVPDQIKSLEAKRSTLQAAMDNCWMRLGRAGLSRGSCGEVPCVLREPVNDSEIVHRRYCNTFAPVFNQCEGKKKPAKGRRSSPALYRRSLPSSVYVFESSLLR
jgi:hypothetical protein